MGGPALSRDVLATPNALGTLGPQKTRTLVISIPWIPISRLLRADLTPSVSFPLSVLFLSMYISIYILAAFAAYFLTWDSTGEKETRWPDDYDDDAAADAPEHQEMNKKWRKIPLSGS